MSLKKIIAELALLGMLSTPVVAKAGDLKLGVNFAFAPRYCSLDLKESKRVPVHPADASFLAGETEVKAESGWDGLVLDLGLEARVGKEEGFYFLAGADMEFDIASSGVNYYGGRHDFGLYKSKKQSSDTRSDGNASFVYDKLSPDFFSLIPFGGIGYSWDDRFLDIKYSALKRGFEREWGHHRNDKEQAIGKESLDAEGSRITLRTGFTEGDSSYSFQASYEDLQFEDAGRIQSYGVGLVLTKNF